MKHTVDDSIALLATRLAAVIGGIASREAANAVLDEWLSAEEGRPVHNRNAYEAKCLAKMVREVESFPQDAGPADINRLARRYADRFGDFWWGGYDSFPDPALDLEARARAEGYVSTFTHRHRSPPTQPT
jgi:hypothetical protein